MLAVILLLGIMFNIQKLKNAVIYYNDYQIKDRESIYYKVVTYFQKDLHRLEVIVYSLNSLIAFLMIYPNYGLIKALIVSLLINEMFDFFNKYSNNIVSGLDKYHEPKLEDKSVLFAKIKLPKLIRGKMRFYFGVFSILTIITTLLI